MAKEIDNAPDLLTSKQAGEILRAKEATLEGWRHRKVGPPWLKLGGLVRYDRVKLLSWIESQRVEVSQ